MAKKTATTKTAEPKAKKERQPKIVVKVNLLTEQLSVLKKVEGELLAGGAVTIADSVESAIKRLTRLIDRESNASAKKTERLRTRLEKIVAEAAAAGIDVTIVNK